MISIARSALAPEAKLLSPHKTAGSHRRLDHRQRALCFELALLLCCSIGCGGSSESYVSGTVSIDGTKLATGTVTFQPVGPGPLTAGAIKDDGSYRIKTGGSGGLAAGEYVVTVQAYSAVPGPGMTVEQLTKISLVPLSFSNKQSSTLRATVEPGSNQIDLSLTTGGDASSSE